MDKLKRPWHAEAAPGLVVSLVSIAFAMGIARASGANPLSGLLALIVSGVVFGLTSEGPFLTVPAPAAGLAPVIFDGIHEFGHGNNEQGFRLMLAVFVVAGILMTVLGRLRLARFIVNLLPTPVIEGMLTGIGMLVIVRLLPSLLGERFQRASFWGVLLELPSHLGHLDVHVLVVGIPTLAVMGSMRLLKSSRMNVVPVQVIGALFGALIGRLSHLQDQHLIHLPSARSGLPMPNFSGLFAHGWQPIIMIVSLVLIGSIEGLATVKAADSVDADQRMSDPNRALILTGIANTLCGLLGGLFVIPNVVNTFANVQAGGKTPRINLWNALFVGGFLLIGGSLVNHVPLSALAAIVIVTGWGLCRPDKWRHAARAGHADLAVFLVTVLTTVSVDLLAGIVAGICLKITLLLRTRFEKRPRFF